MPPETETELDAVLKAGVAGDEGEEHPDVLPQIESDAGTKPAEKPAPKPEADPSAGTDGAASGINRFADALRSAAPKSSASDPFGDLTDEQLKKVHELTSDPKVAAALESRRAGGQAARIASDLLDKVLVGVEMQKSLAEAAREYSDLEDENSDMYVRTTMEMKLLAAGGYRGTDLPIRAAREAAAALARNRQAERNRDAHRSHASRFETPNGQQRDQDNADQGPKLSPAAAKMADDWGIKSDKARAHLAQRLQRAAQQVRARN